MRPIGSLRFGQRRPTESGAFRWEIRAEQTAWDSGLNGDNFLNYQALLGYAWGVGGPPKDTDGDGCPTARTSALEPRREPSSTSQKIQRMDVALSPNLKDRLAQGESLYDSFSQSFGEYYRRSLPQWEAGEEKRPLMIEDLPALNHWKKKIGPEKERIFILLDRMRWDLWEYSKESFFKPLAHQLRIVDEGALWAHLPSSTPRQLELLQQSMEKTFPGG